MYMINLEKINDVLSGLEGVTNNLNKISEITAILNASLSDNQTILKTVSDYDKRTYDLKEQIDNLISNLNNIESSYKLEREAYDKTQEKLGEFNNSVNTLNDNVISKLDEYIVLLNGYDAKREELNGPIVSLVDKLEEIRSDYHKVSSSFEIVDTDLKQFSSKIDLQAMENDKQKKEIEKILNDQEIKFEKKYEELVKENSTLKMLCITSIIMTILIGAVNIFLGL